jgi:cytochrome oxidase assembly protein ShyY1
MLSPINLPTAKSILWLEIPSMLRNAGIDMPVEDVVLLDECQARSGAAVITATVANSAAATTTTNKEKDISPYPKSEGDLLEQSVPPITHAAYAFTWFSLAAAGLFMTYRRFRRPVTIMRKAGPKP